MTNWEDTGAPATLVEMMARRGTADAELTAYSFNGDPRTFGGLWSDIEGFAAMLVETGVGHGDRVVMALPNGHEFFTAFYGTQLAGGIAVPVFAGSTATRAVEMAEICGAQVVVVDPSMPAASLLDESDNADVHVLTTDQRSDPTSGPPEFPTVGPEDVAFIQYTSGSTGDPKGVQLTHANLLTNVGQMIEGMEITPADRFASWLPVSHDLGLIVMTMVPFFLAAPLHLLPTQMADPRPWLETISRHACTFTASPDFGYRLCLRAAARSGAADDYDLSSLRVALNAAEPVRASTVEEFHEVFGLRDVMVAAYGLAEATVGVSMWKPSTPNRIDPRGAVSVGRPFPDVVVRIVDDADQPLPAGVEGHIVVTTPAATIGYFGNPEATATLKVDPDTIRTGDIGMLDDDGYLYILSRAKDVIIQAGQTVYPQEVEEVANAIDGVRYSAAIGVDHGGVEGEQVTVLAEIRPDQMADDAERKTCVIAITNAVSDRFGFRPARVHLVEPKTIPMTYNGKLQRGALRQRYVDGTLNDSIVYPDRPISSTAR
ncbi:MAG TPA: AMP-binding protein [Acidimicrobiales bacterium]|nr:AMP-binding protein [Acidimicrobiales bacterium]